ncbi:hypothetical protein [Streptomyces sp. NPDC059909]|uniref:hypothetical protein n=1 Tax=Streptomyces sp. NPDC059909 TaxID=3346998 RepID=UPI003647E913
MSRNVVGAHVDAEPVEAYRVGSAAPIDGCVAVELGNQLGRDRDEGKRFPASPVSRERDVAPRMVEGCGLEQAATEFGGRLHADNLSVAAGEVRDVFHWL